MTPTTQTRIHTRSTNRTSLRRHPIAFAVALLTALLVTIPIGYVLLRAGQGDSSVWARLWSGPIASLSFNTLVLAMVVAFGTAVLGTLLAWLVERTTLPGRVVWRWLLALPLGVPPYVAAVCYITLLRPSGLLEDWLVAYGLTRQGTLPFRSIFGLGGSALVIILCTYPYVFLLVSAALRQGSHHFEELARVSGLSSWQRFRQVVLPLVRPSVGAGALLAVLYTLADFGVVALMRYQTFSTAIYIQFTGRLDRSGAAVLSLPLIALTLLVLAGEGYLNRKSNVQIGRSWKPVLPSPLGRWRGIALVFVVGVCGLALVLPLGLLVMWTLQGLADQSELSRIYGTGRNAIFPAAWNSVWISALAATLTMLLALAPALLVVQLPGRVSRAVALFCQSGYALPGVVVALSLVLLINRSLPWLTGTVLAILAAYVIRFLPQGFQAAHTAARTISPGVAEAARTLGHAPRSTLWRVTLPLMMPGLASGWAMVFLTTMKELPATLLLRPAGFDTLPVRIWIPANEAVYTEAAPAALLLVLCALLPLALLLSRRKSGIVPV
jgi:iron(III) transport system permease protein